MQYSKEEKTMWLEDWKQSGKSAWAYAKENGLAQRTFVKWTKAKTASKQRFVEIPTQSIPSPQNSLEILIEKGDVKIHIPLGLGNEQLRTIIESVGSLS